MSEWPQGPGWWQASDGRFYPPTASPGYAPPAYRPPAAPGRDASDDLLPHDVPPPAWGSPTPGSSGKAIAALILSIASFLVCWGILAVASLILAAQAKRDIESSYGRLTGRGMVTASRVLSGINLALAPLLILAVAIPAFLGAKERAQDRTVQAELRNAMAAERVYATDNGVWAADVAQLASYPGSSLWRNGDIPVDRGAVYVFGGPGQVGLSARSDSGTCFYVLLADPPAPTFGYADDDRCRSVRQQDFASSWR